MITTSRFVDEGTKFISFDEVSRFTDKGSEFVEFDSAQSYAAVHAPKGGVTLQGKFYPGGEFIPGEALSGLSPLETGFLKGKMKKAGESMPQSQAPKPQPEESKILSKETLALAGQPEHQVRPVKGRAKHNNEWYSSVTPEEGKALAAWIDDAFGLRDCLNGKDCTDETALALDALVERAPPYRGKPVYRGMSLTPADAKTFYKQLQGKRAFKWKAPTSSSKDEEIASEFAMLSSPDFVPMIMIMKLKGGGADLEGLASVGDHPHITSHISREDMTREREVIIKKGTKFRMVDSEGTPEDGMHIWLEEV